MSCSRQKLSTAGKSRGVYFGVAVRDAAISGQHVHGGTVEGQLPRHGVFTGTAAEENDMFGVGAQSHLLNKISSAF